MNWDEKLISDRELHGDQEDDSDQSLEARVAALIDQQSETWPLLREGIEAFAKIETKRVRVEESEVVIQHNYRRIRSTAAAVDKASVENRGCFLCPEGLPPEEKGIAYGDDLVILCNPFPVLDRHLSIVHREHIPQQIEGNVEWLLSLAHDLGPSYFVLYNGPECGASAPDHLHFQACSRELLPIEENLYVDEPVMVEDCNYCDETARNSFELFTLGGCGRSVVVFRGGNRGEVALWVNKIISELALQTDKTEPLINIICTYDPKVWTVYLFPRSKHRPSVFYAEGERRLVVSPGAIDMAGVVVVPEREHFDKIDGERIAAIFSEVSMNGEIVNELVDEICSLPEPEEAGW
jgi:ATP adenylyltransferase/5',5'''-P-1,P-4-tetraphosphate phosphorylase II